MKHPPPRTIGSLRLYDEEDNLSLCTATLIAPTIAITASHCFREYHFRAELELESRRYPVKDIIAHPQAKYGELIPHDLAVVLLDEPVKLEHYETTVGVSSLTPAQTVWLVTTGPNEKVQALQLAKSTVLRGERDFVVVQTVDPDSPVCRGASGAPVFLESKGKRQFVGIISSGTQKECGKSDQTRVVLFGAPTHSEFLRTHGVAVSALDE